MLICEMAAFYASQGKSLVDARREMYEEYGYYYHHTQNIAFEGAAGMKKMKSIMDSLRKHYPDRLQDIEVVAYTDYAAKTVLDLKKNTTKSTELPKSNVIKLTLADGCVVMIRPSGTEPKLKIYYTSIGETPNKSMDLQERIMAEFSQLIGVKG
jgi:phosphoglucomutase